MDSLVLAPLLIAAVLALSGVAKLRSPEESAGAFSSLRIPAWLDHPVAHRGLPVAELVLALTLLLAPQPASVVAAAAAFALMVTYTVVIGRALTFGYPVTCACFGELGMGEVTRRTLVRNVLLSVVGVLCIVYACWQASAPGLVLLTGGPDVWGWVIGAVVTGAVAVLVLSEGGAGGRHSSEAEIPDSELADYIRQPTPLVSVRDIAASPISLRESARFKPVLLLSVSPGCTPCRQILEQIDVLRERLQPVVALRELYEMSPEQGRELFQQEFIPDPSLALFDQDRMAATALELHSTPAAVLLGADGLLAGGPVSGRDDVLTFIDDVVAQVYPDEE